jgi:hypothetical protein
MAVSELRLSKEPRGLAVVLLVGLAALILGGWGVLSYLLSLNVGYATNWHVPGSLYYQGDHYLLRDAERCRTRAAVKESLGWTRRQDGSWRGFARFIPADHDYPSAVFLQPQGHSCVMLYLSPTTF